MTQPISSSLIRIENFNYSTHIGIQQGKEVVLSRPLIYPLNFILKLSLCQSPRCDPTSDPVILKTSWCHACMGAQVTFTAKMGKAEVLRTPTISPPYRKVTGYLWLQHSATPHLLFLAELYPNNLVIVHLFQIDYGCREIPLLQYLPIIIYICCVQFLFATSTTRP